MLNYIIPPIVIVLSLATLIMFLFRKSARIPEALISEERKNGLAPIKNDNKKLFRFTQFILRLTERGMQYFKLVSLKFYNKADGWFHSVKEKREKRSDANGENEGNNFFNKKNIEIKNEAVEKNVVQRERKFFVGDAIFVRKGREEAKKEEKIYLDDSAVVEEEKREFEPRPMISEEVVQPESRGELRNEFERALIERIALNPRDIEAYERLGDYYIEVGNFSDSLSCFEQVLKLSPVNRKARIKTKRLQKIVYNNFSE